MIPITRPFLGDEEVQAVSQAIRSGWISQGREVESFERAVAERVGVGHAVAVTNCTSAIHLALVGTGIGAGDEVIIPSLTFAATANAVVHAGAVPVFVDAEWSTYNIDPDKIGAAITSRTKAIMPVHQIGLAANIDPILELAEAHGLLLIEDAAPALGALYKGQSVGSFGIAGCFSFHPRKVITTGEGGMVTTDDGDLAERLRCWRSHGASISDLDRHGSSGTRFEEYRVPGYNYRMTDMQAAMGLAQIRKLDAILATRRTLAEIYNVELSGLEMLELPIEPEYAWHTYQSYIVRVKDGSPKSRNVIMEELGDCGIATRRGLMATHLEPYYKSGKALLVTEEASRQTFLLPLFPGMTEAEQEYIIGCLKTSVTRRT